MPKSISYYSEAGLYHCNYWILDRLCFCLRTPEYRFRLPSLGEDGIGTQATLWLFLFTVILRPNTHLSTSDAAVTNRLCFVTLLSSSATGKTSGLGTSVVPTEFGWISSFLVRRKLMVHDFSKVGFVLS